MANNFAGTSVAGIHEQAVAIAVEPVRLFYLWVKLTIPFKSFNRARKTLRGIEAMNMIRKGQVKGVEQGSGVSQAKLIESIFGIAA